MMTSYLMVIVFLTKVNQAFHDLVGNLTPLQMGKILSKNVKDMKLNNLIVRLMV